MSEFEQQQLLRLRAELGLTPDPGAEQRLAHAA